MATIQIEINDEMLAKLQRLAAQEGRSIEDLIRYQINIISEEQLTAPLRDVLMWIPTYIQEFINPINGFCRVLLAGFDGELTEQARQDIAHMFKCGQAIETFNRRLWQIADINTFWSIAEPMAQKPVDLLVLLQEITLEQTTPEKTFSLIAPDTLPAIIGDPFDLRLALSGLFGIAFQEAVPVKVKVSVNASAIILNIESEDVIKWSRQFHSRSRSEISLIVARRIIQLHNGTLTVNRNGDHDLIFTIKLPIAP